MNNSTKLLFCFLSLLYYQSSFSYDPIISNCIETPEIYDVDNQPEIFSKSNNLFRKPGSPISANGELIYIKGQVRDINCNPIQNTNIFIWQTNSKGFYQTNSDDKSKEKDYDKNFTGSGQAVTDNLGNYSFITIIPGKYDNRMPHINFLIQHSNFIEFKTSMFLKVSDKDNYFHNIDPKLKENVSLDLIPLLIPPYTTNNYGVKTYKFDITLGEKNIYKSK